jgi:hypothetical protein
MVYRDPLDMLGIPVVFPAVNPYNDRSFYASWVSDMIAGGNYERALDTLTDPIFPLATLPLAEWQQIVSQELARPASHGAETPALEKITKLLSDAHAQASAARRP